MKGPPIPMAGYAGTRFDPPHVWLFAKGYFGPPDGRRWDQHRTFEQARAWGLASVDDDGLVRR